MGLSLQTQAGWDLTVEMSPLPTPQNPDLINNPASQAVIRRIDWRGENAALAPLITVITANNMCAGGG